MQHGLKRSGATISLLAAILISSFLPFSSCCSFGSACRVQHPLFGNQGKRRPFQCLYRQDSSTIRLIVKYKCIGIMSISPDFQGKALNIRGRKSENHPNKRPQKLQATFYPRMFHRLIMICVRHLLGVRHVRHLQKKQLTLLCLRDRGIIRADSPGACGDGVLFFLFPRLAQGGCEQKKNLSKAMPTGRHNPLRVPD